MSVGDPLCMLLSVFVAVVVVVVRALSFNMRNVSVQVRITHGGYCSSVVSIHCLRLFQTYVSSSSSRSALTLAYGNAFLTILTYMYSVLSFFRSLACHIFVIDVMWLLALLSFHDCLPSSVESFALDNFLACRAARCSSVFPLFMSTLQIVHPHSTLCVCDVCVSVMSVCDVCDVCLYLRAWFWWCFNENLWVFDDIYLFRQLRIFISISLHNQSDISHHSWKKVQQLRRC